MNVIEFSSLFRSLVYPPTQEHVTFEGFRPNGHQIRNIFEGFRLNEIFLQVSGKGSLYRFAVQVRRTGSQYRFAVQVRRTGSLYRFDVQVRHKGSPYRFAVQVRRTGSLYRFAVHVRWACHFGSSNALAMPPNNRPRRRRCYICGNRIHDPQQQVSVVLAVRIFFRGVALQVVHVRFFVHRTCLVDLVRDLPGGIIAMPIHPDMDNFDWH